jgi:hypothetical protein
MLTKLRAAGLSVTREGGLLRVEPRSKLTDSLRNMIRENKAQILRDLAARDAADLNSFRTALTKGRLHLCGNCTRFIFGQIDPAGVGWCDRYQTDTHPFVPMLKCAGFNAQTPERASAPEFISDPDGTEARECQS